MNRFYEDGKGNVYEMRDVFGRSLNVGDYVIGAFDYAVASRVKGEHTEWFYTASLIKITKSGFECINQKDGTVINNAMTRLVFYTSEYGNIWFNVFKVNEEDAKKILCEASQKDYFCEVKGELFNREVKAGDMVVFSSNRWIDNSLKVGLVVGNNKFFDGQRTVSAKYCFLIETLDEKWKKTKEFYETKYMQYSQRILHKAVSGIEIGDVFSSKNYSYVCIEAIRNGSRTKCKYLKLRNGDYLLSRIKRGYCSDEDIISFVKKAGLKRVVTSKCNQECFVGKYDLRIADTSKINDLIEFVASKQKEFEAAKVAVNVKYSDLLLLEKDLLLEIRNFK